MARVQYIKILVHWKNELYLAGLPWHNSNASGCRRSKTKHNKNHLPGTKLRQLRRTKWFRVSSLLCLAGPVDTGGGGKPPPHLPAYLGVLRGHFHNFLGIKMRMQQWNSSLKLILAKKNFLIPLLNPSLSVMHKRLYQCVNPIRKLILRHTLSTFGSSKVEFTRRYTRLIYCLPKFYAPYFYWYFYENTLVCML